MKTTIQSFLTLVGVPLSIRCRTESGEAVIPAPDGGYPGFNTAEGQEALFSLTTGSKNTAVGFFALYSMQRQLQHGYRRWGAPYEHHQTKIRPTGSRALFSNTTGNENTANGSLSPVTQHHRCSRTLLSDIPLLSFIHHRQAPIKIARIRRWRVMLLIQLSAGPLILPSVMQHSVLTATGSANIALGDFAGVAVTSAVTISFGNRGVSN